MLPGNQILIRKYLARRGVLVSGGCSGGSRGGSQGAMDPPFQAEHCMQKQDSQQLTEVQQSLPGSTPVLSVQSSYKQSLENKPGACSSCTCTAQKVGVARNFRALRAHFLVCGSSLLEVLDPPLGWSNGSGWQQTTK